MSFPEREFEIKGSFKSVIGKLFLFFFGFLFAVPVSVYLIKSCDLFDCGIGQGLLVIAGSFIFFVVWIKSYEIALSENILSYKSIFQKKVLFKIDEIERVKYQGGGQHYEEKKFKLYPKILLYPSMRGKKGLMEITLNVFNNNDLQKLYDLLESIDKSPFKRNVGKK